MAALSTSHHSPRFVQHTSTEALHSRYASQLHNVTPHSGIDTACPLGICRKNGGSIASIRQGLVKGRTSAINSCRDAMLTAKK
eukprot:scaffold45523_cov20-Tisochrysis_lutea.AAC.1